MEQQLDMISLRSNDDYYFFADPMWCDKSVLLQNVIEVYGTEDICYCIIPVDIKSTVLKKLVEWLEHYKDTETVEVVTQWDKEFQLSLKNEVEDMYNAADDLKIADLKDMIRRVEYRLIVDSSSDDSDSDSSNYFGDHIEK